MSWIYVRLAANGRHEVICSECRNWFWLTEYELMTWTECPHCLLWFYDLPMTTLLPEIQKLIKPVNDCWEWQGTITKAGYGQLAQHGEHHYAHRYVWAALREPLAQNQDVHHICKNKRCVNPEHLEPLTQSVNTSRHTDEVCKRGHDLQGSNVYVRANAQRMCWVCQQERNYEAQKRRQLRCAEANHPARENEPGRCKCGNERYKVEVVK